MKQKFFAHVFLVMTMVLGAALSTQSSAHASSATYFCQSRKGVPTIYVRTADGKKKVIMRLKSEEFGSNWNPLRRCNELSSRFQRNHDGGTFRNFSSGRIGKYRVICATSSISEECNDRNILFTLRRGSNPSQTMQRLMDRNGFAAGNTPTEGDNDSVNINLDDYIENASVEAEVN